MEPVSARPQPLRRQPLRGLERLLPVAQIGIAPDRRTPPAENRWAVPWYSASGGSVTVSPTSTWMECPWLARISVRSSLKAYRCLLSLLTISSRMSRLMGYFLPMPAGSALTSAQPWASNWVLMTSGLCRRIKLIFADLCKIRCCLSRAVSSK